MNKTLTIEQLKYIPLDGLINMYKQGYEIGGLQTDCNCTATCDTGSTDPSIPGEVTTCQKTGQSGWATCDALGYMCNGSTCPGGCSDMNTGATTPSPGSTLPPVSVTPPPSQCGANQWYIPRLGCQTRYKVALAAGAGIIIIYLLGRKGGA